MTTDLDRTTLPNPTPEMLDGDPLFDAIWNVIKTWDVNVPAAYRGYCGANGSHVAAIYNAIVSQEAATPPVSEAAIEAAIAALSKHGVDIRMPKDSDLDDLERERYDALVEALDAAVRAK